MEVTNEQLINIALNIVGYLAAGVFWIMLYRTFGKAGRKTAAGAAGKEVKTSMSESHTPQKEKRPVMAKQRLEFIKLSESGSKTAREKAQKTVPEQTAGSGKNRNRAEVIRMAREMLSSQTPIEKIKQTLPISEGELAMIKDH